MGSELFSKLFTSGTAFFSSLSPKNKRPNPTKNSPVCLNLGLLMKTRGNPMPIMGRAILERLNFPMVAIIQPVRVVPRLAPMITPIDSIRVRSCAFTKLTTITVVADDDWTRQVTKSPVPKPKNLFWVMVAMIFRIPSPATFWMPSLITRIPKRKIPNPPSM